MSVKSILNNFNRFFMICGIGSINYNQGNFKTTVMFHILRYLIICVSFLAIYDANSVIKNDDSEISEITSLIMLSCFELMLVGKFISTICRLFYDNQLSTVLTKLETIHEKLIQLNVVRPINIKIDWFTVVGILGINLYFLTYNMSMLFWYKYKSHHTNTLFNIRLMIEWLISNICPFVALFEYILLILYIKWLVNKINGHILEGYSTISTLRDMYLDVVECLNNANRSIYGLSGTVGLIGTNVVQILKTLYRSLFFPTENVDDVDIITSLIELSIKIINIILLYKIGHITEKEVFILYN
ncbi:hypothetical protein AGLY_006393 [Aphis glycines]|uniref:Gustatory receptor n=1 Tax=Aphis glycines TaxID=307491 RepID=A0A6G0TQX1_APHGL|nr:hypothetical protein AGLY_006393 [Aphis glycines]